MLLKYEAEAKSLRPRPKGPKAKTEARGYEAEAKAKIMALMPVWPRGFNISETNMGSWVNDLPSSNLCPMSDCLSFCVFWAPLLASQQSLWYTWLMSGCRQTLFKSLLLLLQFLSGSHKTWRTCSMCANMHKSVEQILFLEILISKCLPNYLNLWQSSNGALWANRPL